MTVHWKKDPEKENLEPVKFPRGFSNNGAFDKMINSVPANQRL